MIFQAGAIILAYSPTAFALGFLQSGREIVYRFPGLGIASSPPPNLDFLVLVPILRFGAMKN